MFRFLVLTGLAVAGLMAQNVTGRWSGNVDPAKGHIYVSLRQQAQGLAGTVTSDGAVLLIQNASAGDGKVTFSTEDTTHRTATYHLTRNGDRLTGTVDTNGRSQGVTLTSLKPSERTVVFTVQGGAGGRVADIRVVRSLGGGMDERGVELAKKLSLSPGSVVEVIVPEAMVR